MMRYIVSNYKPDVVIINLVGNDYDESRADLSGRWGRKNSMLQLERNSNGDFREILPEQYAPSNIRLLLKKSAIARFLYFNTTLATRKISKLGNQNDQNYEQNVSLEILDFKEEINATVDYIFLEFLKLATNNDVRLLLSTDTIRRDIYQGKNPKNAKTYELIEISREIANKYNIPLIDLTDSFVSNYQSEGKKFNFDIDGHWNQHGHLIAGISIAAKLDQLSWLASEESQ